MKKSATHHAGDSDELAIIPETTSNAETEVVETTTETETPTETPTETVESSSIEFTLVKAGGTYAVFDITALDKDTGPVIKKHGLPEAPIEISMTVLASHTAYPGWYVNVDDTNIIIGKLGVPGSGGLQPGVTKVLRLRIAIPHSIL